MNPTVHFTSSSEQAFLNQVPKITFQEKAREAITEMDVAAPRIGSGWYGQHLLCKAVFIDLAKRKGQRQYIGTNMQKAAKRQQDCSKTSAQK